MVSISQTDVVAVLTGDVVGSTSLTDAQFDRLLRELDSQCRWITSQHQDNAFELMRGDAFQILIFDYALAIKYALLLRMALKACDPDFDCRVCIGIGTYQRLRTQLGTSTGPAFTLSGRGLDAMKADRLSLLSQDQDFTRTHTLLTQFADHQLTQLTERQSAIGYLKLRYPNWRQSDIAQELGANRVSITRSIKTARLDLIEDYADFISEQIKEWYS